MHREKMKGTYRKLVNSLPELCKNLRSCTWSILEANFVEKCHFIIRSDPLKMLLFTYNVIKSPVLIRLLQLVFLLWMRVSMPYKMNKSTTTIYSLTSFFIYNVTFSTPMIKFFTLTAHKIVS